MNIVNDEFKTFLSSNKKLFTTDELQILESNDYSNAAEILFRKKHLFPSSTRFGRVILSMVKDNAIHSIQGIVSLLTAAYHIITIAIAISGGMMWCILMGKQ